MTQPTHSSNRILRPVKGWFMASSLILAVLIGMIPLGRMSGFPDLAALGLAFWCVREPLKIGMGAAFLLGVAMDIVTAGAVGQHALAYVLLAYAAARLSRRILWFPLSMQALHVLPLLLVAQCVMAVTRMMCGAEFPGLPYFLGSFISALLWHPLTYLLLLPQYQPLEKDLNRPI